ncbi:MAG TPA: DUF1043 family protein [Gammaproteobacteria bacterium]
MTALLALGIGLAAGMLLTYLLGAGGRTARQLREELAQARSEHAAYRREVTEHFTRTATAVNRLTESYREVHEQLRSGAQRLCDDSAAETALAFDQSKLIGTPTEVATAASGSREPASAAAPATAESAGGGQGSPSAEAEAEAATPPRDYADDAPASPPVDQAAADEARPGKP